MNKEFDHKSIPIALRERRAVRAKITIWFGLIPLMLGSFMLIQIFRVDIREINKPIKSIRIEDSSDPKLKKMVLELDSIDLIYESSIKKIENIRKILSIETETYKISYFSNNRYIRSVSDNTNDIISSKHPFIIAILLLTGSFFWFYGHIKFYKDDPYKVYH